MLVAITTAAVLEKPTRRAAMASDPSACCLVGRASRRVVLTMAPDTVSKLQTEAGTSLTVMFTVEATLDRAATRWSGISTGAQPRPPETVYRGGDALSRTLALVGVGNHQSNR